MKRTNRSRSQSRPKRTSSPPRSVRVDLKPGEILVTNEVIVMARMGGGFGGGFGATTTVTCQCTKSEPDTPDCKPKTTTFPGGVSVSCTKSGGCSECKSTTTTTSFGLVMA
jgi:hypothetical protein